MNVLLFGATAMVGQGVLRECLRDPGVSLRQTVGRSATDAQQTKLGGVVHADLGNYDAIESKLSDFDACFFCLGVSSAGMSEADYQRVTYGITVAAAEVWCRLNPKMTFLYVSGAGTDSSEHGGTMWARVKGKTENALLRLHGVTSKTPGYRFFYAMARPLLPLLRVFPIHSDDARDWICDAFRDAARLRQARSGNQGHPLDCQPQFPNSISQRTLRAGEMHRSYVCQ